MNHYLIPHWPAPSNVHAYTTLREGGHSLPPFDSFNMGARDVDNPAHVDANRQQLQQELQLPNEPRWLRQIHGKRVICVEMNDEKPPYADAAYSLQPGYVCVIMTADCLPVLLCDRGGTKVAAIHGGWRGLASGIIAETLQALQTSATEILAWLGPAIGPDVYEIGEEVRDQFMQLNSQNAQAFKPASSSGKWFANLYTLARIQLQNLGVNAIYGGDFCTFSDKKRFFSHRRDQGKTGRMASLIWLSSRS